MPRAKKTRAGGKRPKPTLPQGDEGKQLSKEQRQQKLDLFLDDYDQEVAAKLDQMRQYGKQLADQINAVYRMELVKLSKDIRDIKLSEFLKLGGSLDLTALEEKDDIVDKLPDEWDSKLAKVQTIKKSRRKPLDSITEESEDENRTVKRATRRTGRGNKGSTLVANTSLNMSHAPETARRTRSTLRSVSSSFQTPGYKSLKAAGWETPLVTPKFDPRLPVTPGTARAPKPGEVIMSMAGSPVIVAPPKGGQNRGTITQKIQVITDELENVEVPDLNAADMDQIQALHNKILNLLKQGK